MPPVCVCILIHGDRRYFRAGRRAIASVLRHSRFPIVVATDDPSLATRRPDRVRIVRIDAPREAYRAAPFLLKFRALEACLAEVSAESVLLLDADTLLVADLDSTSIEGALAGRGLGMVEQRTIVGSGADRGFFRSHYERWALALLAPESAPPPRERFRYFNSGVVLARRAELLRLVPWALARIAALGSRHDAGEHMVADQDYFQVWANTLHPESCTTLPWRWNHAAAWDEGFPREGAWLLHLTNFCRGPSPWAYLRLDLARAAHTLRALVPGPSPASRSGGWT
jgi:lipopolysaccharide biosynthesis glycosyltransferase